MSSTLNSGNNQSLSSVQLRQWELLQTTMDEINTALTHKDQNLVGFEQLFDVLKHCLHFGGEETQEEIRDCLGMFMPMVGMVGPFDNTIQVQEYRVKLQYIGLKDRILALGKNIAANPVAEIANTTLQIQNTTKLIILNSLRVSLERESRDLGSMLS